MLSLILAKKYVNKFATNQLYFHLKISKVTRATFSRKPKLDMDHIDNTPNLDDKQPLIEEEEEDEDFDDKEDFEKRQKEEMEKEEDKDERETKDNIKQKIASFFNFSKSKATYTFADTGGKDINEIYEDETVVNSTPNFYYSGEEDEIQTKLSNDFMKMMTGEKEIEEKVEIQKVEEKIVKTSFDLFKEFLQLNNDNHRVKEAIENKDYDKDVKPLLEKYVSEYNMNKTFLKRIYFRYPSFFCNDNTIEKVSKTRDYLFNKFQYNSPEIAEIIAAKPRIIDYPSEKLDLNIMNLQNFLKVDAEELKKLLFDYPLLFTVNEKYYSRTLKYMKIFLKITDDEFITLAKKLPLILRSDPIKILSFLREINRYRAIPNKTWIECLNKNPAILVFKPQNLSGLFTSFSKIGFSSKDTIEFILKYPEFLIENRFNFVHAKIQLFHNFGMTPLAIKRFVKKYPFVILKSYTSYVRKINYYKSIFERKIEQEEVFPFIFLFNLKKDIAPRFELIKKYDRNFDLKTAFESSPEEFVKAIGSNMEEWKLLSKDGFPLHERDLLFIYDKFYY